MEEQTPFENALQSTEDIARVWNQEDVKRTLISQIMEERKEKNLEPKKINEKDLIIHYFNAWLKVDKKELVKKLLGHPLISTSDYEKVKQIVKKQEEKRNYYTIGMTVGQLTFYSLFMSKHRIFYNFFRKKYRIKYMGTFKKFSCCFMLMTTNLFWFEYMFNKRTPILLNDQNYFKKYNIPFDIE